MTASCKPTFTSIDILVLIVYYAKIAEEGKESGKRECVNFKRVVWHDSFYELLDSICAVSKTGLCIKCANGITSHLYPVILMLSADYGEQYLLFFMLYSHLCLHLHFEPGV